ncbi:MAG: hypothetical protein SGILL_001737 [Bacillariaceae sp.]
MCNPNSAVASRRYRLQSGRANLLAQKLVGSLMQTEPPKTNDEATPAPSTTSSGTHTTSKSNEHSYSAASYDVPSTAYNVGYDDQRAQPFFYDQQQQQQQPSVANDVAMQTMTKKRRRKPQKPGLTAKGATRHFVEHHYIDHANDPDEDGSSDEGSNRKRGGVSVSFPLKLHSVLEQVQVDGFAHIISWQPHGRCFVIHNPKEFTETVMPRYFKQTKLTSFQRQLNLYGYQRLTRGNDSGGYYHERFLRGRPNLCKKMVRTKVKGTKFKAASSPDQEPNFYKMPPVVVTPHNSDCDNSEDSARNGHYEESYHPITMVMENQGFEPPHRQFEFVSRQPQEAPMSPLGNVNRLALQTFGPEIAMPSPPRLHFPPASPLSTPRGHDYVASPIAASAPSIPAASSYEYMDQAVDELFLDESQSVTDVMDFVSSWDMEFEAMGPVTNDLELGNLLDKILED